MSAENILTIPETTHVLIGNEKVIEFSIAGLAVVKHTIDLCGEYTMPSVIVTSDLWSSYKILFKNGVKIRWITDIRNENISYCKEIMNIAEVRHLDNLKGGFVVSDSNRYVATYTLSEGEPVLQLIYSNVKKIVEFQQYLFDTLWNKAIPAKQRIRELEEGELPEKLEIIEDTEKSISRAFDIMNKTRKELLVLFATPRTFTIALQAGATDMYKKMSENGVNISVLVPRGGAKIEENDEQRIAKLRKEIAPSIKLRFSEVDLNTRITIMISDRGEFMSWELKDDTLDDPYLAGGIATYSNIKSLASSYAVIFDNLWKITEFAENLRIANIKLESNEKAMKEFINIAAHELRTPLQPILGLSEMLHDARNDPKQQRKLLDVIVRNAHKLEYLAENILDVTKIESGKLKLAVEDFDLYELVQNVVNDFQRFLPGGGNVTINFQELSYDANHDHRMSRLAILGDRERIAQVITNLLRNALNFTKEGTIDVRVGRKDSRSFSEALVYISDCGQGIHPEVMNKLFEKFTSKSEKGTGLGLFISKSIVEAHGGKIWAENNKDGRGATFSFTLPLAT
jgi:two-component system, OmpR family, sensor histidine kinase VicK